MQELSPTHAIFFGISLRVTQHFADDDQALSAGCCYARKGMAQVMQPHIIELGCCADAPPGFLKVPDLLAANDEGIAL